MAEDKKKPTAKKSISKSTSKKPVKQAVKKSLKKKTTAKSAAKGTTKKAVSKAKASKKGSSPEVKDLFGEERKVVFNIQRAERKDGELKTHFQSYDVPFNNSTTVLQALEWIKGSKDGTLTFRRSCRASICGSCGMFINSRSRLACKTKVADLVDGDKAKNRLPAKEITIRPQGNQPVLKDLVVDLVPFYNKVQRIKPYVQEGPDADKQVDKTSFEQVNMVSNCIMCGLCYSDCTAMVENPDFTGPAALAKAFRFVSDPREGHKVDRLKELSEVNGIWDCTRCGMCVDACPKGVAPMEAIVKLRTRALNNGVTNNAGARHALAFKGDIRRWGLLNEPLLLIKTLGLRIFGQLGNALHLAKKGKVPSPLPHKTENLNEVDAIFDQLKKNPINVETRAEDTGPGAG